MLVTNLRDEDDEELLTAVNRLSKQHQVLVASLQWRTSWTRRDHCRFKPCSEALALLRDWSNT